VDDGIAMGHGGMLYSLPSRELIADSVEYMVNAHCADALVCISNCDKITPGMLLATLRLNIPTIFVSGGPMEAGKLVGTHGRDGKPLVRKLDLIDSMIASSDAKVSDAELGELERSACPTCGSCSGMFTANSMNCLNEALGLALPGNGTLLATHARRAELVRGGRAPHRRDGAPLLHRRRRHRAPAQRSPPSRRSRTRSPSTSPWAGRTNTVLHLLAMAQEAGVDFTMSDIDRLSRKVPNICKVAPSSHYHVEDVHRAGGVFHDPGRARPRRPLAPRRGAPCTPPRWRGDRRRGHPPTHGDGGGQAARAGGAGRRADAGRVLAGQVLASTDDDAQKGCIHDVPHAYSKEGGLAVLYGKHRTDGCIVKTAGVDESIWKFEGRARVFHSQDAACDAIKR